MGFLLVVFLLLLLVNSVADVNRQKAKLDANKAGFIVEDVKKNCPPHKWNYQEVKDKEGNTVRWRLICDLCGPLKPSNGPARME